MCVYKLNSSQTTQYMICFAKDVMMCDALKLPPTSFLWCVCVYRFVYKLYLIALLKLFLRFHFDYGYSVDIISLMQFNLISNTV